MSYLFLNNFTGTIVNPVADADVTFEISESVANLEAVNGNLYSAKLTIFDADSGDMEIIAVNAVDVANNTVTVERGLEDTTAKTWPAGATFEMRMTSQTAMSGGVYVSRENGLGNTPPGFKKQNNLDGGLFFFHPSTKPVLPDPGDGGYYGDSVLMVPWSDGIKMEADYWGYGVALGAYASVANDPGEGQGAFVVIGGGAEITGGWAGIAIGAYAASGGSESTAVGSNAVANGDESVAVGPYASTAQRYAVSIGDSTVNSLAGISIGYTSDCNIDGGVLIAGLHYLSKNYPNNYHGAPSATVRSSSQVTVATDAISLLSTAGVATLEFPANVIFIPDAFDVVVVESNGAGGAPEIQIGPDDVTPAAYLAATPVTKAVVGGRETHGPLVTDGITALRVAVVTAGTGTAYKVKVVARGYVMEV